MNFKKLLLVSQSDILLFGFVFYHLAFCDFDEYKNWTKQKDGTPLVCCFLHVLPVFFLV